MAVNGVECCEHFLVVSAGNASFLKSHHGLRCRAMEAPLSNGMTVCSDSGGPHLQGPLMTERCHLLPSAQVLLLSLLGGVGLAVRQRFGSRHDAARNVEACWSVLESHDA